MEKDEVWMDENRKRSRKRVGVWDDDEARNDCLYTYRNNTRCLTRRGGGDGSAVSRRGDDEARANCLAVTVQQSRGAVLTRRRDSDDMRGDSRGAVLTTGTHTLSRSLKNSVPDSVSHGLSQIRNGQSILLSRISHYCHSSAMTYQSVTAYCLHYTVHFTFVALF
ncbi:hypothetical protein J6590_094769 [Homalodisca vitripennis]|nr:hypothetical protein J6590_094769 [Homalodisca vitripennis]